MPPTLNLKIHFLDRNVTRTIPLDQSLLVSTVCDYIRDKENLREHQNHEWGLFMPNDDYKKGVWLESNRNLDYYMLKEGDVLEYKKKIRPLRIRMMDESIKTVLVDESQPVSQLMVVICNRIGIANCDEYSLVRQTDFSGTLTPFSDVSISGQPFSIYGTLSHPANKSNDSSGGLYGRTKSSSNMVNGTLTAGQHTEYATLGKNGVSASNLMSGGTSFNTGTLTKDTRTKNEKKMDEMKRRLHTDDEIKWVDHCKTLREQGIEEFEILLLRRKFFYSDQNIDSHDPVQLNLLYVQCRDAIIDGTHPVTLEQACQFAGIQCQIQFGDYNPAKHKPGFLDLNELIVKDFRKMKGLEKRIYEKHRLMAGNNEIDTKVHYVKLARGLKTYGVTFFLVKEKVKGKNKLRPRLLGVTKESVLKLDENTKECVKSWPLTRVKRWGATPHSFTLDFGDYQDSYYSVQTAEGEKISGLIAGYIDIILKNRNKDKLLGGKKIGADGVMYMDEAFANRYGEEFGIQESLMVGRDDESSALMEEVISPHRATYIKFQGANKNSDNINGTDEHMLRVHANVRAPDMATRSGRVRMNGPAHASGLTRLLSQDGRNRECLEHGILRIGQAIQGLSSQQSDNKAKSHDGVINDDGCQSSLQKSKKRRVRFVEDSLAQLTANSAKIVSILSTLSHEQETYYQEEECRIAYGSEDENSDSTTIELRNGSINSNDRDTNSTNVTKMPNSCEAWASASAIEMRENTLRSAVTEVAEALEALLGEINTNDSHANQTQNGANGYSGEMINNDDMNGGDDKKLEILCAAKELALATTNLLECLKGDTEDQNENDIESMNGNMMRPSQHHISKRRITEMSNHLSRVGECGARVLTLLNGVQQHNSNNAENNDSPNNANNIDHVSTEFQLTTARLMSLAKGVANSAAHLVLGAKRIANYVMEEGGDISQRKNSVVSATDTEDTSITLKSDKKLLDKNNDDKSHSNSVSPNAEKLSLARRDRIVAAATKCAMKTSELITCVKVMAPTITKDVCRKQTADSVDSVSNSVTNVVHVAKTITQEQNLLNDLDKAAKLVLHSLDDLLSAINQNYAERDGIFKEELEKKINCITGENALINSANNIANQNSNENLPTDMDSEFWRENGCWKNLGEKEIQAGLQLYRASNVIIDELQSSLKTRIPVPCNAVIQQAKVFAQATAELVSVIKSEAHAYDDLYNKEFADHLEMDSNNEEIQSLQKQSNQHKKALFDSAKKLAESTTHAVEYAKYFSNPNYSSSSTLDRSEDSQKLREFINVATHLKSSAHGALSSLSNNKVSTDFMTKLASLKATRELKSVTKTYQNELHHAMISEKSLQPTNTNEGRLMHPAPPSNSAAYLIPDNVLMALKNFRDTRLDPANGCGPIYKDLFKLPLNISTHPCSLSPSDELERLRDTLKHVRNDMNYLKDQQSRENFSQIPNHMENIMVPHIITYLEQAIKCGVINCMCVEFINCVIKQEAHLIRADIDRGHVLSYLLALPLQIKERWNLRQTLWYQKNPHNMTTPPENTRKEDINDGITLDINLSQLTESYLAIKEASISIKQSYVEVLERLKEERLVGNIAIDQQKILTAATIIAKHTSSVCNCCRLATNALTNFSTSNDMINNNYSIQEREAKECKAFLVESAKSVANLTRELVSNIKSFESETLPQNEAIKINQHIDSIFDIVECLDTCLARLLDYAKNKYAMGKSTQNLQKPSIKSSDTPTDFITNQNNSIVSLNQIHALTMDPQMAKIAQEPIFEASRLACDIVLHNMVKLPLSNGKMDEILAYINRVLEITSESMPGFKACKAFKHNLEEICCAMESTLTKIPDHISISHEAKPVHLAQIKLINDMDRVVKYALNNGSREYIEIPIYDAQNSLRLWCEKIDHLQQSMGAACIHPSSDQSDPNKHLAYLVDNGEQFNPKDFLNQRLKPMATSLLIYLQNDFADKHPMKLVSSYGSDTENFNDTANTVLQENEKHLVNQLQMMKDDTVMNDESKEITIFQDIKSIISTLENNKLTCDATQNGTTVLSKHDVFVKHRDGIIDLARRLVDDSKMIVAGASNSPSNTYLENKNDNLLFANANGISAMEDHIGAASASAVRTMAQLATKIKTLAHELYNDNSIDAKSAQEMQTILLTSVKDIAISLGDLIQSSKHTSKTFKTIYNKNALNSEKDSSLSEIENNEVVQTSISYLKQSAKVMVSNVTRLLKTLKNIEDIEQRENSALESTIQSLKQQLRLYETYGAPIQISNPRDLWLICRRMLDDLATYPPPFVNTNITEFDGNYSDRLNGLGILEVCEFFRLMCTDLLLACKSVAHHSLEPNTEHQTKLLTFGKEACLKFIQILETLSQNLIQIHMKTVTGPLLPIIYNEKVEAFWQQIIDVLGQCITFVSWKFGVGEESLTDANKVYEKIGNELNESTLEIDTKHLESMRWSPNSTEKELLAAAMSIEKAAFSLSTPTTTKHKSLANGNNSSNTKQAQPYKLKPSSVKSGNESEDSLSEAISHMNYGNTTQTSTLKTTQTKLNATLVYDDSTIEDNFEFDQDGSMASFDTRILGATQSIAQASAALIRAACSAQRELVRLGKLSPNTLIGRGGHSSLSQEGEGQWSYGLISAAKLVVVAIHSMCQAAHDLVQITSSTVEQSNEQPSSFSPEAIECIERLITGARSVASSTAQLILACRVKAGPHHPVTERLDRAALAIRRATERLISAALKAIHGTKRNGEDYNFQQYNGSYMSKPTDEATSMLLNATTKGLNSSYSLAIDKRMVGSLAQEMEAQQEILRKERELEEARQKLGILRKAKYKEKQIVAQPPIFYHNPAAHEYYNSSFNSDFEGTQNSGPPSMQHHQQQNVSQNPLPNLPNRSQFFASDF